MDRADCPAGLRWDILVNHCVRKENRETTTEAGPTTELPLFQPESAVSHGDSEMALSQSLWIFVSLATLGSIVALTVWIVIYKRHTRLNSTSEEAQTQQEPPEKTETTVVIHPIPTERPGGESFTVCREAEEHAGTGGAAGLAACGTVREHRIPLPATELGGTALVTTKTV